MSESGITLTVTETTQNSNTDRPTVGLPAQVRARIGVLSGDQVIVEGPVPLVATVWPVTPTESDQDLLIDRQGMARAGLSEGDTVTIRPATITEASELVVLTDERFEDGEAMIRRALLDRPVSPDDRFSVADTEVQIAETRPGGTVLVTAETSISIQTDDRSKPTQRTESTGQTTYEDIGGLDQAIELVRESVELPLADPELFEQLGIQAPTGVLLHGPPGTGKTLIAEAVAATVDATFYHISGPEILSKYKGESEQRLREVFEQARDDAPAIIFFDEIDAIATTRESDAEMESRVVAQLLSLMDGLESRGDVVVIGATNRLDAIDPALRRPGRFDREIEIGVPDESGRREILAIHTEDVPIADDVSLEELANRTHGFVGADLRALVTEAALVALRRHDTDQSDVNLEVTEADFTTALSSIDPSAMREFIVETPETSFADIGGLADAKAALTEAIEWPLENQPLFDAAGADPPSGVLLAGPSGTGKTLLARAIASESEVNFIHVAGPELLDKYVGESERAIREVFERARQAAPSIIFFDEIDAIAGQRGTSEEATDRVVSQLLTELDGLTENPSVVVLAATNRLDVLDPGLLRPGRLEQQIEVLEPDEAARREILEVHTREMTLSSEVDLDALAAELDGATGADIAALCREAAMAAVRETVEELDEDPAKATPEVIEIQPRHIRTAQG